MTREEINEFIEEGKKYSIITSKATTVVGKVTKMGDSALFIEKEGSGKKAMISYSTIEELEECEDDQQELADDNGTASHLKATAPVSSLESTPVEENNDTPVIAVEEKNEINKNQKFKNLVQLVQPSVIEVSYGKEAQNSIKKKFRSEDKVPEVWSQIFDRFNTAIKNHALDEKWKGIFQSGSEMLQNNPDCLAAYYMMAYFFVKREEYSKAANCFCVAQDYIKETACRIRANEELHGLFSLRDVILSTEEITDEIWYTFIYYAAKLNMGSLALDVLTNKSGVVFEEQRVIAGLLYLALNADKLSYLPKDWELKPYQIATSLSQAFSIVDVDDPRSDLKNSIKVNSGKNNKEHEKSREKEISTFEGTITAFKTQGRYGFIDNKIYFYILQVQDEDLRMALLNGGGVNTKVHYSFGSGVNGKSGNRVRAIGTIVNQNVASLVYKGYITDYYRFAIGKNDAGDGKVTRTSDSKEFLFKSSAITNDTLRRKLDTYRNLENIDVFFKLQGKKAVSISETDITEEVRDPGYVELPDWEDGVLAEQQEDDSKNSEYDIQAGTGEKSVSDILFSKELSSLHMPSIERTSGIGVLTRKTGSGDDSKVRKACDHLYSKAVPNPFTDLPLIKPGDYRRKALLFSKRAGTEEELKEAEKLFILSLQTGESVETDIGDLCTLYLRFGGEYVVKGLQLLDVYGKELQGEKLLDLRVQLIDKSGNMEALAVILNYAIQNTVKTNKKLHYTVKLLQAYLVMHDWNNTLLCAEKVIGIVQKTSAFKDIFNKRKPALIYAYRARAICYYIQGDLKKADQAAKETIKLMPTDEISGRILDRTFVTEQFAIQPEADYADELEKAQESFGLSLFAMRRIGEINISTLFSQMKKVKKRIHENKYIGNNQDAQRDIHDILAKLQRNFVLTNEIRSQDLLGVAKIAMDARESDQSDNKPISEEQIRSYVGRSMAFLGDYLIMNGGNIDVARFCYIEALRYMRPIDNTSINNAFNYLVYSFFLSQEELAQNRSSESRNPEKHIEKFILNKCLSLKDLLISAFMLNGVHSYEQEIMEMLYLSKDYYNSLVQMLMQYTGNQHKITEKYDFEQLWKASRERFNTEIENLNEELKSCVYENNAHEKMEFHNEKLEEMSCNYYLFNLDVKNLKRFIRLSKALEEAKYKEGVDEREEAFSSIITGYNQLLNDINREPSEFGINYLYKYVEQMEERVVIYLNELYAVTRPEISKISLLSDSVYVRDNIVNVTILFENEKFKQTADSTEVILILDNRIKIVNTMKRFSSIRSGEQQEYVVTLLIDPQVVADGQFDFEVELTYQYHKEIERYEQVVKKERLNVNLNSKESFVKIENRYSSILRSSSVTDPDLFKGRDELIDSICKSLRIGDGSMIKNRGIMLWGQRRVGKNSVKDYLKERIAKTYPGAYIPIELGSVGDSHNLQEVLSCIAMLTEETILSMHKGVNEYMYPELANAYIAENMEELIDPISEKENYMFFFKRYMTKFMRIIEKNSESDKNIPLYIFDEFSYLYQWIEKGELDGSSFMRFWKGFIQDYGICAIIIAQDNIPVWSSQYPNEFSCMNYDNEITYLGYNGARDLICDPCKINGESRFNQDAVDYIFSLTKGSAYLIVILCKAIIDYLNESCTEKATKAVVEIVLNKGLVTSNTIFNLKDFEPQLVDVTKVGEDSDYTTAENKTLLKEIARRTIRTQNVAVNSLDYLATTQQEHIGIFQRLTERHIISMEGEKNCSITLPILKLFLLKEQGMLTRDVLIYV